MFGVHNWINENNRFEYGGYLWTHGHVILTNHTIKSYCHGRRLEGQKEEATRNNQMRVKLLGKPHM